MVIIKNANFCHNTRTLKYKIFQAFGLFPFRVVKNGTHFTTEIHPLLLIWTIFLILTEMLLLSLYVFQNIKFWNFDKIADFAHLIVLNSAVISMSMASFLIIIRCCKFRQLIERVYECNDDIHEETNLSIDWHFILYTLIFLTSLSNALHDQATRSVNPKILGLNFIYVLEMYARVWIIVLVFRDIFRSLSRFLEVETTSLIRNFIGKNEYERNAVISIDLNGSLNENGDSHFSNYINDLKKVIL